MSEVYQKKLTSTEHGRSELLIAAKKKKDEDYEWLKLVEGMFY